MDTFLVITGVLFVAIIAAIIIINKLNINIKIKGIDLKYILTGSAVVVGLIALIVLKVVLGNKNKIIDELLAKLRKIQSDSELASIDIKIKDNQEKVDNIDNKIDVLKVDYENNKTEIERLEAEKNSIDQKIIDLNKKYKEIGNTSLNDSIERMSNRLN
jgi:predicted RNase H-like nuclease (RuvC/YqgF family)